MRVATQTEHFLLLLSYAAMIQINLNVCITNITKLYHAGLADQLHAAHRFQKHAKPGALPGSCYQVHSASRAGHRGRQAVQSAGVVLTLHSFLYPYAGLLKGLQERNTSVARHRACLKYHAGLQWHNHQHLESMLCCQSNQGSLWLCAESSTK